MEGLLSTGPTPSSLHTRTQDFGTKYLEENFSLRGVLIADFEEQSDDFEE